MNAGIDPRGLIVDIKDSTRRKHLAADLAAVDLLTPVCREGSVVAGIEPLSSIRQRVTENLASLHQSLRRLMNPHEYPVGLDVGLHEQRDGIILATRTSALESA